MNNVQKTIFEIFKTVSQICEENEIRYYAIGGTCIGAVRHNGFIPWDDDLDIAIPIEDFDRFLEVAEKQLPDCYKLYTSDNVRHNHYVFAKVTDVRTTFVQNSELEYPDAYKGIFIDVMPLSGVPKEGRQRKAFLRKLYWYTKANQVMRFPFRDNKSIQAKLLWIALKPLSVFLPYSFFSAKHMELLRKWPFNTAEYVGYVWWSLWRGHLIFPKDWFESAESIPFETTTIKCPCQWHNYLTEQFGDYMTPPKKELQVAQHDGLVDVDRPYTAYINKQG